MQPTMSVLACCPWSSVASSFRFSQWAAHAVQQFLSAGVLNLSQAQVDSLREIFHEIDLAACLRAGILHCYKCSSFLVLARHSMSVLA